MSGELLDFSWDKKTYQVYFSRPSGDEKKPLVLVCHAWGGRDNFTTAAAHRLNQMGYAALCLDFYGKGVLGKSVQENERLMTPFIQDRKKIELLLEQYLQFGQKLPSVNAQKIAVIGFCFGGLCALDMARSLGSSKNYGAVLRGAVSFHGLFMPREFDMPFEKLAPIQTQVLVLHGNLDPMAPPQQVMQLGQELTARKALFETHVYGKAYHAFTNPEANDVNFGAQFNAHAEKRSWLATEHFLGQVF